MELIQLFRVIGQWSSESFSFVDGTYKFVSRVSQQETLLHMQCVKKMKEDGEPGLYQYSTVCLLYF